jgi:HlyD family secretion protein
MLNRKTIWIVGGLVAAATLAAGYRFKGAANKTDLRFDTAKVDRGRLTAKVTASGSLSAIVTVQVGSQVSGRLQQILVDYNSSVRKGQLIAKIDPQLFEATYEQARANHVAAKANLAKAEVQAVDAERQSRRAQSLADDKLVAQADLDTSRAAADAARAQVDAAKGSVAQAEASLHQAQINLAYTNIYSPTDGVVISRSVDVGQTVAASLQAPTLFVIAEDLRKMQVDTSVAEADIGRLRDGMPATFTVDAYPGENFRGQVRQIRNAPQTVQNVVTYDAVIDIDNSALKLKPGMTANVTFIAAERADVLRVSNAALRFRPSPELLASAGLGSRSRGATPTEAAAGQGERRSQSPRVDGAEGRRIWVLADGKPRPVLIKTGVSDGTQSEIVEGQVAEGDLVIVDAASGNGGQGAQGGPPGGFPRRLF